APPRQRRVDGACDAEREVRGSSWCPRRGECRNRSAIVRRTAVEVWGLEEAPKEPACLEYADAGPDRATRAHERSGNPSSVVAEHDGVPDARPPPFVLRGQAHGDGTEISGES